MTAHRTHPPEATGEGGVTRGLSMSTDTSDHSTPATFRHPLQLAYAIGRTPPGRERDQAIRIWLRAMRDALGMQP